MRTLVRRLRLLESRLVDGSGLVPQSEAWYAHWQGQFDRMLAGDDVGVPLEVIDRIVAKADAEEAERRP